MAKGLCQCRLPNEPAEWVKGKVVGSGSYGTVHLAMDKGTGALFVVKSAGSEMGIQSLENEAAILENLNSPYVVSCLGKEFSKDDIDDDNVVDSVRRSGFHLFIEYMAGGSLADVVEKFGGRIDEKLIRLYTRKILQGLSYLHGNGIVHCDLKCKNVLLGLSGDVKLADFGFARKISSLGMHFDEPIACGTPLWMAPEVLRNESLDFSADIWSLGCTLIEMANEKCRPPWRNLDVDISSNPMAAILKIARNDVIPEFPSNLSSEGLHFLSKCLERDPKKRWTAMELLNHPFVSSCKCGNNSDMMVKGYDHLACSPASVLDLLIENYDSGSDESLVLPENDNVNPFSKICHPRTSCKRSISSSSGEWITVRCASQH